MNNVIQGINEGSVLTIDFGVESAFQKIIMQRPEDVTLVIIDHELGEKQPITTYADCEQYGNDQASLGQ